MAIPQGYQAHRIRVPHRQARHCYLVAARARERLHRQKQPTLGVLRLLQHQARGARRWVAARAEVACEVLSCRCSRAFTLHAKLAQRARRQGPQPGWRAPTWIGMGTASGEADSGQCPSTVVLVHWQPETH